MDDEGRADVRDWIAENSGIRKGDPRTSAALGTASQKISTWARAGEVSTGTGRPTERRGERPYFDVAMGGMQCD